MCLADLTSKYHYRQEESTNIDSFECTSSYLDHWINMYKRYLVALEQIKNSNVPYDTICYEDFMADQTQYIADRPLHKSQVAHLYNNKMISLNLSYKELCTNYHEVEEKIRKQLC
jgi:hypothetical protein